MAIYLSGIIVNSYFRNNRVQNDKQLIDRYLLFSYSPGSSPENPSLQKKVHTMSSISFALFGFVLVLTEHFVACNVLRKTVSDEVEKRTVDVPVSWCHLKYIKSITGYSAICL